MIGDSSRWTSIMAELQKTSLPEDIRLDKETAGKLTVLDSLVLLKSLLKDFDVPDEDIIPACETAKRRDTADWAICSEIEEMCDVSDDDDIVGYLPDIFIQILARSKGFSTDWKYGDEEVEAWLNSNHLFGKRGLKVGFTPHGYADPFEVTVEDTKTGDLIGKTAFTYSDTDYRKMGELIDAINKIIEKRDILLLKGDDGMDTCVFILFERPEYERLNKKYGDIRKVIDYKWLVGIFRR